jgi:hypothetical protein
MLPVALSQSHIGVCGAQSHDCELQTCLLTCPLPTTRLFQTLVML